MKQFNILKTALVAAILAFAGYAPALAMTCGTFTVGAGGDYPDLAAAIADLNGATITCPVTLNILPGTYTGTAWQVQLANISGTSTTNRVTIQAQNGPGTVSISIAGGSSTNYAIRLNDVSFVTIKNLSIANTTTGTTGAGRVIDIAGSSANDSVVGCTLTGAAGAATSNNRAIVLMGTSATPSTGTSNVVAYNTIQNGYCAVYIYGTSATSLASNDVILYNTITEPYTYGIYNYFAGNLKVLNNTILGTAVTFTHGIYSLYGQDGGDISNNTVTMNTTTGSHFGIYNDYQNSTTQTSQATMNNNIVSVIVTSGTSQAIYNRYGYKLSMNDNTFSAKATTGKSEVPTLMYYCTGSQAINNSFITEVTTGSIAASAYYFMSYASDCYVKGNTFTFTSTTGTQFTNTTNYAWMDYSANTVCRENTFNFTSTTGVIGKTSSGVYCGFNYANGSKFNKNTINHTSSHTSTIYGYGFWGYYSAYSALNTSIDSNTFNITMDGSGTKYMMGYYMFYNAANNGSFSYNNLTLNSNSSASIYWFPIYSFYSSSNNAKFNNNNVVINQTGGTIYTMGQSGIGSAADGQYNNNNFTVNPTSATVYLYYTLYAATTSESKNNTYNLTTTGTMYFYGCNYQGSSVLENNTFNLTYGSGNMYFGYYLYGTTKNNTYNFNGGSVTMYSVYYPTGGKFLNNEVNVNSTGTIYNYEYYPSSILVANNKFKFTSTTGAIYNLYQYHGSASYSSSYFNNVFDLRSTSGTIYGRYPQTNPGKFEFIGNVVSTKTSGASYLSYSSYGNYGDQIIANNIFHSNSTNATTNNFWYQTGGSSSVPGKAFLYNNIFSRSNSASAIAFEISDTAYTVSDYNLLYSPGTVNVKSTAQSITTTDLNAWKLETGLDQNSVFHDPAYVNAANFDFRPDASSVNSWARQGRGIHVPKDTMDILGNPRARDRYEGVPDIGAYEFTPTSIPENATAIPSTPAANSTQVFIYAGDTVCSIDWGNTVPASINVKQYTGLQAAVTPGITERMYFYVDVQTPLGVYEYKPNIRYKNPWLGNISNETNARIAKSSNNGLWAGYNYKNGVTDSIRNYLMPKDDFDSLSSKFTGVENARIGIRCVVLPMGLQHSGVTAFTATETWEPVFSPYGYQIIVDSVQSPLDMTKVQFTSVNTPPTYPISGLQENTTYYVNIRTICGLKDTSDWAVDSFRTMITCHAPAIYATSITDKQAVIFWDTIQTAISYEYTVDQSPNPPSFGTTILTNTTFASGLNPGTTYYAHVRSHCSTIYDISGWNTYEFNTLWPAGVDKLNSAAGIAVYPNPAKDILNVRLSSQPSGNAIIKITDVTGKEVFSSPVQEDNIQLDIKALPSGMYLVKYVDLEHTSVIKVSKD